MSDLFPHRARIGSTDYGLDADHYDHRQRDVPAPDLIVTEDPEPIVLWHPDGVRYRVVDDMHRPFGFQPKADD